MLELPASLAKKICLIVLAGGYIFAGLNHFLDPGFYLAIMPPYLPAHLQLIYVSGFFEIMGGLGVLSPRVRSQAGWGLVFLLVAVFPANLHMAIYPEQFPDIPNALIYGRLPLQLLLIAWAYWATRPDPMATDSRS